MKAYLDKAEKILAKRSNEATLKADGMMSQIVRLVGKDEVLALKKHHYNIRLEEFVVGADNARMIDVIDNAWSRTVLQQREDCGQHPRQDPLVQPRYPFHHEHRRDCTTLMRLPRQVYP